MDGTVQARGSVAALDDHNWFPLEVNIPVLVGALLREASDPTKLVTALDDLTTMVESASADVDPEQPQGRRSPKRLMKNEIAHTGFPLAAVVVMQAHNADAVVIEAALRAMMVVCHDTPEGKQIIGEVGGVEVVCSILKGFPQNGALQERTLKVLQTLTSNNDLNQKLVAKERSTISAKLQLYPNAIDEATGWLKVLSEAASKDAAAEDETLQKELKEHAETLNGLWSNDVDRVKTVMEFWTKSCTSSFFFRDDLNRMVGPYLLAVVMKSHAAAEDVQLVGAKGLMKVLSPDWCASWRLLDPEHWRQDQITKAGGVEVLVDAMKTFPNNKDLQFCALKVLDRLNWTMFASECNTKVKVRCIQGGSVPAIVAAMNKDLEENTDCNDCELQTVACALLEKLSRAGKESDEEAKEHRLHLIECGAMKALRGAKREHEHGKYLQDDAERCLVRLRLVQELTK